MPVDKTCQIVDHLRQRFKDRFGIELTRDLRLSLITQIKTKKAEHLYTFKGAELWRVFIYNDKKCIKEFFDVMFDKRLDHILTVLPPIGSDDFNKFADDIFYKYGINKNQLEFRRKTSSELEHESIKRLNESIENKKIGLRRLKQLRIVQSYKRSKKNVNMVF